MRPRLRINGIYDHTTLKLLRDLNVDDFGFDFRARSYNFLQQYVFLDLLKKHYYPGHQLFLHYSQEANFVIQKMLTDLKEELPEVGSFFLEFSDQQENSFYEQFNTDFHWHYQDEHSLEIVLHSPRLKGVVIDYRTVEFLHAQDLFYQFYSNVLQEKIQSRGIEVGLALAWDADVFPSLYEFANFDYIIYTIDDKIEISYRNVDLLRLKKQIQLIRQEK